MIGRLLTCRGYGCSVQVDAPTDLALDELTRHLAPEISVEKSANQRVDILLTRWNGVFHLVMGERRYGPYRDIDKVSRALANGVHFVLGKRSPMTFIHAGAIEIDGRAVIFPARSRWGKSTLVSALVEQGCGYLSDEYAVVSSEGAVFPLSKPIRIRVGEDGAEYLTPSSVSAPGGLSCAAVVLTRYEKDGRWSPKLLTPGFAIMGILPTVLQSREQPERTLDSLTALVDGAQCYESARGDGQPSAEALRELTVSQLSTREARA